MSTAPLTLINYLVQVLLNVLANVLAVVSTAYTRIVDCAIPSSIVYLDCHSLNAVYLISCRRCFL